MKQSLFALVFVTLITLSLSLQGTVLNTVFKPQEFVKKDQHVEASSHPGEYRYTFDNVNFQITSNVLQGTTQKIISQNNVVNYQADPQSFQPSDDCYIEPSLISLEKISVTNASIDQIRAYYFNNDRVFVLTGDSISYYALSSDTPNANIQLSMIGQLPNISTTYKLDQQTSQFVSIGKRNYILDTQNLYLINIRQQGPKVTMNLSKVEGYESLSEYGQIMKVTETTENNIVVLSNQDVTQYTCNSPTKCSKKSLVTKLKEDKHNYVDVSHYKQYIILLQEVEGIFLLDTTSTTGNLVKYSLGYEGKFIKMQTLGSTIQVIGEYYGKRYVVELFIHNNSIVVNRFYNQITGLRDIDFFDNKAIFMGDDQIMVIGHSINRNLLMNLTHRQNRQIYLSYGIVEFDVIQSISNPRKAYIVGITLNHLILIVMNQASPSLVCDIDSKTGKTGVHRLVVQMITTNCGPFDWKQWRSSTAGSQSFCRIFQSVSLQISTPVSSKLGLILTIAAGVICFVGILVLAGFACKFRRIKFKLFQKLVEQINIRRNAVVSTQSI